MPQVAAAAAAAFSAISSAVAAAATAAATAIGSATLAITGSATLAAAAANAVMGLATIQGLANAVSIVTAVAALTRKPPVAASGGSPTAFKADPQAGLPIVFGETAVGPFIVHGSVNGKENNTAYLSYRLVYSAATPIQALGTFTASGEAVTFGTDGGEGASGRWQHRMWSKWALGTAGQAALAMTATGTKDTPADHGGNQPEWTANHRLQGLVSQLWVLQTDSKKFPNGVPKPLQAGQWMKAWDPRADSTFPGGSGSQRPDDPATWGFTRNPFLIAIAWLRGRYYTVAGGQVRAWGCGVPIKWIDFAAYLEGANIADANGWRCDGVAYSTEDKFAVLTALLQAGGGFPCPKGGLFSCMVRTPRPALTTITADDWAEGEGEIETGASYRDRINTIAFRYRSPAHQYELTAADEVVTAAAWRTEDGETRTREATYPYVQGVDQAAQLAAYDAADSREGLRMVLPGKSRLLGLRIGEAVNVDLSSEGLAIEKMLVLGRDPDPLNGRVVLSLRSETDAKHDFCLGKSGVAPSLPGLTAIDETVIAAPPPLEWDAVGVTLTGGGAEIPAIVITGEPHAPEAVTLLIRYRPTGSTDWSPKSEAIQLNVPVRVEIPGLTPTTSYDVEIAYRSRKGVDGAWLALGPVVSGSLSVPGGAPDPSTQARGTGATLLGGTTNSSAHYLDFPDVAAGGLWTVSGFALSMTAPDGETGTWSVREGNTDDTGYVVIASGTWIAEGFEPAFITLTGDMSGTVQVSGDRRLRLYFSGTSYATTSQRLNVQYLPPA
jgi:hypothetical protein